MGKRVDLTQLLLRVLVQFVHHLSFISLCNRSKILIVQKHQNKIMKYSPEQNIDSLSHQLRQTVEKTPIYPSSQSKKTIFISRVERFASQERTSPGPGSYEPELPDKHTVDFRSSKVNERQRGDFPLQHAWINGSNRHSFMLPKAAQSGLGPGEYIQPSQLHNTTESDNHSSWAKGKRFSQMKAFQNKLGPGQYDEQTTPNKKYKQLSVFKSKSPKSFMDELITESKKLIKYQKNPEDDQPDQVVRFDQTLYETKKKVDKKSSMFMSKCQRPELKYQSSAHALGPGAYSIDKLQGGRLNSQKGPISAMHYNLAPLETAKQPKERTIGPGSYEIELAKSSKRFGRREPLGIIFKAERFSSHNKKYSMPGPGEYMSNRFTMIKQQQIRLKNKGSFTRKPQKIHNFGTAPRATLRNGNQVPFGMYEVKYFDIQHKLDKQKEHYQKLKLMEVTLPAFNSKQRH